MADVTYEYLLLQPASATRLQVFSSKDNSFICSSADDDSLSVYVARHEDTVHGWSPPGSSAPWNKARRF